ncbi:MULTISPECIES: thioredoxin family protein [unclassified Arcicella]|uniref:thioredoxin family protein n=1 Tax=unclassified Arcicella TaxID=2644986 RepID=UPI0028561D1D|nr:MULTISPECIES: thioredoxin family protein [unclassified Arcicella]MDR6560007.1 thiol:disulfide interchange protein [Arcicella sp. BE51]MDR6810386.1 thiol:disulfide interchange protein [Arcicella sp. BE140]MDR6821736.1 thiol:disulfide interchange protein [Arcicella sp. BE139]
MLKTRILSALLILFAIGVNAKPTLSKDPVAATGIQFFKGTFKQALAKAKKENKMIMMDCYTTWCGPCKILKNQVFTDKALGDYMNQKYICVAMDYENGEGPAVAQKYPVDAYPSIYFIDSNGKPKTIMVGVPNPIPNAANVILAQAKKFVK